MSTKVKANSWSATAAEEIRRIQTRWGVTSLTKFSALLGINIRTLSRLYSDQRDTVKYESVQQMFSNLMTSVMLEFNTPEDANKEMQLLFAALAHVTRAAYPPNQELVNKALHEMENQRDCGLPIK